MEKSEFELLEFNFTAEQITLEREHFISNFLGKKLDSMIQKLATSDEILELLKEKKQEVQKSIMAAFEADIQAAAQLDQKNFSIPDHVLICVEDEHIKKYSKDAVHQTDKKIEELKNTYLENAMMIESFKTEYSQYEAIEAFVNDELNIQKEVQDSFATVNLELGEIEQLSKQIDKFIQP
ncbi:uncharacterized protein LOC119670377 [Teleopsis dalmanni]|uniref:uncharacterized protein LOC119670377 n=1 Tax=Teleopsis dalmanni TaxID=139649 RepID=UPI0018CD77F6|nr:uncharacterized protein LOC119670377 [Teleopsis dalmanni]